MKGRGLLALSDGNRRFAVDRSHEVDESYDHDALSLEDLDEYDPPAQQMQDKRGIYQPPPSPVRPAVALAEFYDSTSTARLPVRHEPVAVRAVSIENLAQPDLTHTCSDDDEPLMVFYAEPVQERWTLDVSHAPVGDEPDFDQTDSAGLQLEVFERQEDIYYVYDDDVPDDTVWLGDLSVSIETWIGSETDQQKRSRRCASLRNLRYERSRQLAENFLSNFGLLDERNLDLLSEVIYHKRWTATQYRVIKLIRDGLSVGQVHAAFELRRVWGLLMDSNPVPDYWRKPLSWDSATALLRCLSDWDVEVDGWHSHFLQSELECWLAKMSRGRWDSHFIDYLLNFRLPDAAHVEQVVDPAFCIGLDGSHNPLFDRAWMEDWDDMGPPAERQVRLNVLLGREGLNLF